MAIQQECQRFQEEQNQEERSSGDLASVITAWCNNLFEKQIETTIKSEREAVMDGTIDSCIADSGTTATCGTPAHAKHFEDTGEVSNKTFIVANGTTEEATEIKKLPYKQLREEARKIHMVPGITTSTLLSTGKLADANYISIFDAEEVNIYDANNTKITTTRGAILRGY